MNETRREEIRCKVKSSDVDFRAMKDIGYKYSVHVLDIQCRKNEKRGQVIVDLRKSGEFCSLDYMQAEPPREGFGSASLPLILRYMLTIGCGKASGIPLKDARAFWTKQIGKEIEEGRFAEVSLR